MSEERGVRRPALERRIVQIAAAGGSEGQSDGFEFCAALFALCEDGSVWRGGWSLSDGRWKWERLPMVTR